MVLEAGKEELQEGCHAPVPVVDNAADILRIFLDRAGKTSPNTWEVGERKQLTKALFRLNLPHTMRCVTTIALSLGGHHRQADMAQALSHNANQCSGLL